MHKLTKGKDASEIIEREGVEALYNDFKSSQSAFQYLVTKASEKYNISSGRGKSDFVRFLSPFLLSTESSVERDTYIQTLSSLLSVSEESIRADVSLPESGRRAEEDERSITQSAPGRKFNPAAVSIDLFAMLYLANHRDLFPEYRGKISFGDLKDREAQTIYMALENAMRNDITTNEIFLTLINDEGVRNITAASFALDEYTGNVQRSALDEAADRITLRGMEERREVLMSQLKSFSDSLDDEQISEALERKKDLDHSISVLKSELFAARGKEE